MFHKPEDVGHQRWSNKLLPENAAALAAEIERRFGGRDLIYVVDNPLRPTIEIYSGVRLKEVSFAVEGSGFCAIDLTLAGEQIAGEQMLVMIDNRMSPAGNDYVPLVELDAARLNVRRRYDQRTILRGSLVVQESSGISAGAAAEALDPLAWGDRYAQALQRAYVNPDAPGHKIAALLLRGLALRRLGDPSASDTLLNSLIHDFVREALP